MGRNKTIEDSEVLSVARQVFREGGHGASTREIARAAGISQAVLFQRFGSKDELFFRAMTPEVPDLEAMLGAYPPKDAFEHLLAISERLASYLRAFMPTLLKVLAMPGVEPERLAGWHDQLPFMPITGALVGRLEAMREDGLIRAADPHAAAVALIAALHSLVLFEVLTTGGGRMHPKANVRAILKVLWQGLEPNEAAAPAPEKRAPHKRPVHR